MVNNLNEEMEIKCGWLGSLKIIIVSKSLQIKKLDELIIAVFDLANNRMVFIIKNRPLYQKNVSWLNEIKNLNLIHNFIIQW